MSLPTGDKIRCTVLLRGKWLIAIDDLGGPGSGW
jgi:hypothetical protein